MTTETIKRTDARALAMQATGLIPPGKNFTHRDLPDLFNQMGYVQIDAISVIERAHHHILWSRVPTYQASWLNDLLESRQIFEYWGHAASYLPFSDYRYYLPLMESFVSRSKWATQRLEAHGHLIPEILKRLEAEGPLAARHFDQQKRPGSGWWNWKPAKVVLELLYWQGLIMVSSREGFDKVYDLAERVIPVGLNIQPASQEELAEFCLQRALQAHGLMSFKEMTRHLPLSNKDLLKSALAAGTEAQQITPLKLEGVSDVYYTLTKTLNQPMPKVPKRVQILSPFDNLVIQRLRFKNLFGGDYLFEAYVPAEKRRYGYFSLPVLLGDELAGYLDCKAHRNSGLFEVKQSTWLRKFKASEQKLIEQAIARFATFNGCTEYQLDLELSEIA